MHVSLICMHTAVKRGLKSTVGCTRIWDRSDCMLDHKALSDGFLHGTAPQLLVGKVTNDARLTTAGVRVFRLGFPHLFSKV